MTDLFKKRTKILVPENQGQVSGISFAMGNSTVTTKKNYEFPRFCLRRCLWHHSTKTTTVARSGRMPSATVGSVIFNDRIKGGDSRSLRNMPKASIAKVSKNDALGDAKGINPKAKKGILEQSQAIVHGTCTFNNTHIIVRDFKGHVLFKTSGGLLGRKMGSSSLTGGKKSTAFAALYLGEEVAKGMKDKGINRVDLILKGFGKGRSYIHRGLRNGGLKVLSIKQATNLPHNGCRPRKSRRLLSFLDHPQVPWLRRNQGSLYCGFTEGPYGIKERDFLRSHRRPQVGLMASHRRLYHFHHQ